MYSFNKAEFIFWDLLTFGKIVSDFYRTRQTVLQLFLDLYAISLAILGLRFSPPDIAKHSLRMLFFDLLRYAIVSN